MVSVPFIGNHTFPVRETSRDVRGLFRLSPFMVMFAPRKAGGVKIFSPKRAKFDFLMKVYPAAAKASAVPDITM